VNANPDLNPNAHLPSIPRWRHALAACLLALAPGWAAAWDMAGLKTLTAHTRDGQHIVLGSVRFDPPTGATVPFVVTLDPTRFTDFFLSMKEFKCVDGRVEVVCHVPYPYPQPRTVTATQLAWLEHSLMFMFKLPNEFGAKLWNGLYFRFERTPTGLLGRAQSIDLNRISAPSATPDEPPFRAALRDDIAAGARWIDTLSIE
jgi:hypothetical protein